MKDKLKWAMDILSSLTEEDRLELAENILENLKFTGSKNGRDTAHGQALYKKYNSGDYVLTGISCNLLYLRCEGSAQDLNHFWLHPWGMPSLVYYKKGGGEISIVNQAIRLDDSHLYDIPSNHPDFKGYNLTSVPRVRTKGKTG